MNVLIEDDCDYIRSIFIDTFIDVRSNYYIKYIKSLKEFSDGMFCDGYMWECLIGRKKYPIKKYSI